MVLVIRFLSDAGTPRASAFVAVLAFSLALVAGPATAEHLDAPKGEVILVVSGEIELTNHPHEAHFDRAMLEEIGLEEIRTTTLWTEGQQVFEGVPLHRLVTYLKGAGGSLRVLALNDYAVEIPWEEANAEGPILAIRNNGESLSVRDKGPVWMVYPYDAEEKFQNEVTYARSVWQLERIEILP